MAFKLVILFAVLAVANAGYIGAPAAISYAAPAVAAYAAPAVAVAPAAIGATHQSTVRSYDGLSAISQYSKAVDTPFSSVRKSDVRVTNDAVSLHHAPLVAAAYATPAVAAYHATPAVAAYHAAPAVAAYHAPAVAAYHAPGVATYAPGAAVVAHTSFDGFGVHYVY